MTRRVTEAIQAVLYDKSNNPVGVVRITSLNIIQAQPVETYDTYQGGQTVYTGPPHMRVSLDGEVIGAFETPKLTPLACKSKPRKLPQLGKG